MTSTRLGTVFVWATVWLILGGCSPTYQPPESKGLPNREPLDRQELLAALARARQLSDSGLTEHPDFGQILARAHSHFPAVPVAECDEECVWTRVELNQEGQGFDAIRFSSPPGKKRLDLLVAIVFEARPISGFRVHECGGQPLPPGISSLISQQRVELAGLDLPDKNLFILGEVHGGAICPSREFLLHFGFEDARPLVAYVKLKMIPTVGGAFLPDSVAAEQMGIQYPPPLSSAAPLSMKVNYAIKYGQARIVRPQLEAAMQRPTVPRELRSLHVKVLLQEGNELRKQAGIAAARSAYLQSAQEIKKLKQDFGTLAADELQLYQVAMYREACCLAQEGKSAEAFRSLREAIQHGFHEWQVAEGNIELASLWGPEFSKVIKEMQFPTTVLPAYSPDKANADFDSEDWTGTSLSVFRGPSRVALAVSTITALLAGLVVMARRRSARRTAASSEATARQSQEWRFHFSFRWLAIFVALICAYLSSWNATKKYAVDSSTRNWSQLREDPDGLFRWHSVQLSEDAPLPLIIRRRLVGDKEKRQYFLWLFGPELRLFERTVDPTSGWEMQPRV